MGRSKDTYIQRGENAIWNPCSPLLNGGGFKHGVTLEVSAMVRIDLSYSIKDHRMYGEGSPEDVSLILKAFWYFNGDNGEM